MGLLSSQAPTGGRTGNVNDFRFTKTPWRGADVSFTVARRVDHVGACACVRACVYYRVFLKRRAADGLSMTLCSPVTCGKGVRSECDQDFA